VILRRTKEPVNRGHRRTEESMHIIVIAWLFVITLFALAQPGWGAGLATFLLLGVLPLGLLGLLARRRRSVTREQRSHQGNGADAERDHKRL